MFSVYKNNQINKQKDLDQYIKNSLQQQEDSSVQVIRRRKNKRNVLSRKYYDRVESWITEKLDQKGVDENKEKTFGKSRTKNTKKDKRPNTTPVFRSLSLMYGSTPKYNRPSTAKLKPINPYLYSFRGEREKRKENKEMWSTANKITTEKERIEENVRINEKKNENPLYNRIGQNKANITFYFDPDGYKIRRRNKNKELNHKNITLKHRNEMERIENDIRERGNREYFDSFTKTRTSLKPLHEGIDDKLWNYHYISRPERYESNLVDPIYDDIEHPSIYGHTKKAVFRERSGLGDTNDKKQKKLNIEKMKIKPIRGKNTYFKSMETYSNNVFASNSAVDSLALSKASREILNDCGFIKKRRN